MPYFLIKKEPVFLSSDRYSQLENYVYGDQAAMHSALRTMGGMKESKVKDKLMFKALTEFYITDPENFPADWVEFDLMGLEASENIWDLLYDYSCIYGYTSVVDLRDTSDPLSIYLADDDYQYPMGKVFGFNHFGKSQKWWRNYSNKMDGRTLQVIINTQKINRIKGTLKAFIVEFDHYMMFCGKYIAIKPK